MSSSSAKRLRMNIRILSAVSVAAAWSLGAIVVAADDPPLAFEVAALKLSGPVDPLRQRLLEHITNENAGMVAGDGQRAEIKGMSAAQLIATAYRTPLRQIVAPSWAFEIRFEVEALIPAGQGRDKAPDMLRTLLEERLALKAHRETRKMPGYILSVADGGPKLEEAPPLKPTNAPMSFGNGPRFAGFRMRFGHASMAQLANALANQLKEPVEDRTGIKGFYVFEIKLSADEMNDEFERSAAFQDAFRNYGLRLTHGKIDAPVVVVDNLSKTPADN